jgi:hypothetical protein|tara:strand:+ start:248 stop:571 length:324 start_codon:yes stop_codon:yes gene_type:complete
MGNKKGKRELQIPTENILNRTTTEDIVFRSPATIPDVGIKDLIFMKKVIGSDCSYYDIAPTENQILTKQNNNQIKISQFESGDSINIAYWFSESTNLEEKMGEINNI